MSEIKALQQRIKELEEEKADFLKTNEEFQRVIKSIGQDLFISLDFIKKTLNALGIEDFSKVDQMQKLLIKGVGDIAMKSLTKNGKERLAMKFAHFQTSQPTMAKYQQFFFEQNATLMTIMKGAVPPDIMKSWQEASSQDKPKVD